jgi:uncharacterized protein YndB with AHSA1/START domain
MKVEPLIVERTFNASPEKIWKALTEKEKIKEWSFDMDDFKPDPGFEFRFYGEKDGRKFLHLCKVLEVIKEKKLRYSWKYDGYQGESFVTYELIPEGNQTKLRLIHEGIESFPSDNDDFSRENFTMGWTEIIGTLLKNFIEKPS